MKTLCLDFGNTRLKAALFNNDMYVEEFFLADDKTETVTQLLNTWHPDKAILSSVINHNEALEALLSSRTVFHKLSHLTSLNFTTPVGKPDQ